MLRGLINISRLFAYLITLKTGGFVQFLVSRKVLNKYNKLIVQSISENPETKEVFAKIKFAAILIPILAYEYQTLRGKNVSSNQKEVLVLQSAIAIAYDALIDISNISKDRIDIMLTFYDQFTPENSFEHFTATLLKDLNLLIPVSLKKKFQHILNDLHNTHIESSSQKSKEISKKELLILTRKKGSAFPFFLFILNPDIEND